jgi:uncharacterized Zn-binding protein involved in type VI secretion
MPEAARAGDAHECHLVEGNHPHVGGPAEGSPVATVTTGHRPQVRAGDRCRCDGPPDFIVTGSSSVYVDGKPAARKGDRTAHPPSGMVTAGLDSVHIGGARRGATLGGGVPSRRTCEVATWTRRSRDAKQTYGNCGVESVRQIVNLRREVPISETDMLSDVIANHEAGSSVIDQHHGGSTSEENVRTLARHGVAARAEEMSFQQILLAVAEGRGVITSHRVSILWGAGNVGRHALLVTGLTYDEDGNLRQITVNDTGWGVCSMEVDPATFENSLDAGEDTVVTDHPIW